MKIESSEVSIKAETSFDISQETSTEFTSQLINAKLDKKDNIEKQNFVRMQVVELERILLVDQKQLTHQDRINKDILEIILSKFTENEDFKFYPENSTETTNKENVLIKESNFKYSKEYYQKSDIEFNTQALVQTNRGQINIDLNLSFSQEFYEKHESEITSKKAIYLDPLIINYDHNLTSFDNINSQVSFEFDLNSDGKNELIPELNNGSGFLALDKNDDGTINNGNELFGANTGNGFNELKEYDKDNNSWIDENDSIFNDLLIWEKNEKGESALVSLGQAGIGAIYLSAVDSVFTYSSGVRDEYAKLKQSSFYLKEDGKAGLVTSVDFAT